jgi:hypothetical protein
MTHKIAGVANALAAEREAMDEMRAWHATLLPMNGVGTLKFHRHTAAAADVETEIYFARVKSVQRYGGDVVAGGEMVEETRAVLETATTFYCPLPFFYASTATTDEVVADTVLLADTWANAGSLPCGVRIEVKAGGVTGPTACWWSTCPRPCRSSGSWPETRSVASRPRLRCRPRRAVLPGWPLRTTS